MFETGTKEIWGRITRMRGTMPNEESVILLKGKTIMDKNLPWNRFQELILTRICFVSFRCKHSANPVL